MICAVAEPGGTDVEFAEACANALSGVVWSCVRLQRDQGNVGMLGGDTLEERGGTEGGAGERLGGETHWSCGDLKMGSDRLGCTCTLSHGSFNVGQRFT